MSVAVDKTPEEVGVRLRPRVPAEDTLTVQAPVILTFTSVVEVSQMEEGLLGTVLFSQVVAEELEVGERRLEETKAKKNENSPKVILWTKTKLDFLSFVFNK